MFTLDIFISYENIEIDIIFKFLLSYLMPTMSYVFALQFLGSIVPRSIVPVNKFFVEQSTSELRLKHTFHFMNRSKLLSV